MMSDYDRAYLEQLLSDIARQRAMIDALWPRFMELRDVRAAAYRGLCAQVLAMACHHCLQI